MKCRAAHASEDFIGVLFAIVRSLCFFLCSLEFCFVSSSLHHKCYLCAAGNSRSDKHIHSNMNLFIYVLNFISRNFMSFEQRPCVPSTSMQHIFILIHSHSRQGRFLCVFGFFSHQPQSFVIIHSIRLDLEVIAIVFDVVVVIFTYYKPLKYYIFCFSLRNIFGVRFIYARISSNFYSTK